MCIPPADENPGPHFALLEKLARQAGVDRLSMGMSGDYELAVAFGATSVRVGSAIFGSRVNALARLRRERLDWTLISLAGRTFAARKSRNARTRAGTCPPWPT